MLVLVAIGVIIIVVCLLCKLLTETQQLSGSLEDVNLAQELLDDAIRDESAPWYYNECLDDRNEEIKAFIRRYGREPVQDSSTRRWS